jgi:hypothetical protein
MERVAVSEAECHHGPLQRMQLQVRSQPCTRAWFAQQHSMGCSGDASAVLRVVLLSKAFHVCLSVCQAARDEASGALPARVRELEAQLDAERSAAQHSAQLHESRLEAVEGLRSGARRSPLSTSRWPCWARQMR